MFLRLFLKPSFVFLFFIFFSFICNSSAEAATLTLNPSGGTFVTGGTFESSIILDTKGESINAVDIELKFPKDKLQVVPQSVQKSIISIWTSAPSFNNQTGVIRLQGGIPGGVNVTSGVVATFTFRVKSVGTSLLKFSDESKVLLDDGKGTDVLANAEGAIYNLILPPPQGPVVVSETHPDQSKWYRNSNAIFNWAHDEEVDGYSYILNNEIVDISDDISEGERTSVAYKNLTGGEYYFHIKALRKGAWGGTTHYGVKIDSEPPAEFPVKIIPSARTSRQRPVIEFSTTDFFSGVDHYELKIIPLKKLNGNVNLQGTQPMFVEVTSPYVPAQDMELGTYDVIVRAYDKAGNFREVSEKLSIVTAIFSVIEDRGLLIKDKFIIPWIWIWAVSGILILIFGFFAWYLRHRHLLIENQRINKNLPVEVRGQLEELKDYRKKYGNLMVLILCFCFSLFYGSSVLAQEVELAPPIIITISKDISNEEIFYIGGQTEPEAKVTTFLQNIQTGETVSWTIDSDKHGEWFYRHNNFLLSGDYIIWTQSGILDQKSPPSPQIRLTVRPTAFQFGSSRLSFDTFYLLIIIFLAIVILSLASYTIFHAHHARKKQKLFLKEVQEAEEAVRRGFAILSRDIMAELMTIKKAKLTREISEEMKEKEKMLIADLAKIERYIGKEVADIISTEYLR